MSNTCWHWLILGKVSLKQHVLMLPCWLSSLSFQQIFYWKHTRWWCHVGIQVYYGLAEFPLLTPKQHRVMVPCWPLCWASLAPAAQHESDNQGIVHLTPSSSTFSHHGCILYSVLLYSVLCTSPPNLPSSHITARWTQKSPNHPKPFKSATSRFWVTLFPFHSFSDFHHTRSDRNGRKMILKHFPY